VKISIIGSGYVGLTVGTGLASKGHEVTCVDIDEKKVEKINKGECPLYEEGLPKTLEKVISEEKLEATTDTKEAVKNSDATFLAVGTPTEKDGSINLDHIKEATKDAAKALKQKENYHLFVVKSTVVPGTTENEIIPILEEERGKKSGEEFGVCMNPEFLREGTALEDFLHPDRIVIGEYDEKSGEMLEGIYKKFEAPVMRTSLKTSELIKYASNSLLATKISFINEIGNLCKNLEIDIHEVADGIAMDSRINRAFLNSGDGFGGSCFPKDVRALISFMEEKNVEAEILQSTVEVNEKQKTKLLDILEKRTENIEGKTITVLGLAFKPGTDDVRNSPAIDIIAELKQKGAKVKAYDPEAIENMKKHYPDIKYCETRQEAIKNSEAVLILTNWPEFNEITLEELRTMDEPVILEGMKQDNSIPEENKEGITWP